MVLSQSGAGYRSRGAPSEYADLGYDKVYNESTHEPYREAYVHGQNDSRVERLPEIFRQDAGSASAWSRPSRREGIVFRPGWGVKMRAVRSRASDAMSLAQYRALRNKRRAS